MHATDIHLRYEQVKKRIEAACAKSRRDPRDVRVVAVTKYATRETTEAALQAGIGHIGESRVQDAVPKREAVGDQGTWHFIGHLQSNKVKEILPYFSYVHSLDRLSLAKEIQKRAHMQGRTVQCMVQLNISGEKTKHGLAPDDVLGFLDAIRDLDAVRIRGLMTMAPHVDDPEESRDVFRELKDWRTVLQRKDLPHVQADHLSMGMSNDFDVAVEEGATFVRLGSILVGRERLNQKEGL